MLVTTPEKVKLYRNKMEKEQTTFDVQIGDGMDIGIMGENGEHRLSFMDRFVVVISFSFQIFTD